MTFGPLQLGAALLAGGVIGLLAGTFGLGGGFLVVPVLNILLGVPMEFAVGAGATQVLGPATTSLLARRVRIGDLRLPLTISGGLLVGIFLGSAVLREAKSRQQLALPGGDVPLAEVVVLCVYFVLLIVVGTFALWEVRRQAAGRPVSRGWLSGLKVPPMRPFSETASPRMSIPVLSWFGLGVGFLAGLLGMSGGLILVPGLIYLLGIPTQRAVVLSLVIVWLTAFQATAVHAWQGRVDLLLVLALLAGGTFGARIGSELGVRLGGHQLRRGFGWVLLATSGMIGGRLGLLF